MAVPKKKASKVRTRRRFATYVTRKRKQILARTHLVACGNCSAMKLLHHVCTSCGFYNGRQVLDVSKAKKVTTIEA